MMEWTDRHARVFHRQLTKRAALYTEMVTADAVIHGDRDRLIGFSPQEHPLALQLGGSDPRKLAAAARIGADFGYDEINLNVGCPSDRVQEGRFGACLMAEPELVADCMAAMRAAVGVPATVKCRIGIDDQDGESDFQHFVETVAAAGVTTFVVHARKAWLNGLSPKENREIPPLDYDRVYRLKRARPDLTIVINGGITDLDQAEAHLAHVDGVMLGRAAYQTPYVLAEVDARLFGEAGPAPTREEALTALLPYVEAQLAKGLRLHAITRHVLGLYHARPRGRAFRRHLSENGVRPEANADVLREAIGIAAGRDRARRPPNDVRRAIVAAKEPAMTLSLHDIALLVAALLAAGAVMGVLSGMLGIGGGGVLVPVLYETFGFLGVDPAIRMQMSVGTSLAVVGVTSWRTFTSHRARGSVDVALLKRLGPAFVVGVVLGVVFARNAGGAALKWAWVIFGSLMATKLAFGRESWRLGGEIPRSRVVEVYALAVGFISVLLSIAGAAYMVTLMTLYGRPILQAVGTSSGFGPLVSIPGVIGFVWAGWQAPGTPPASLGFVNLLGAALILPASLALAPVGVRIAHGISKRTLEIAFAVFLYIVVLRFLASLLGLTG